VVGDRIAEEVLPGNALSGSRHDAVELHVVTPARWKPLLRRELTASSHEQVKRAGGKPAPWSSRI